MNVAGRKTAQHSKVPRYSAEHFDEYITQLHSAFSTNKHAVTVLSSIRSDPVTHFKKKYKNVCVQLHELPTKEQVFEDPAKMCSKFINELTDHIYLTSEELSVKISAISKKKGDNGRWDNWSNYWRGRVERRSYSIADWRNDRNNGAKSTGLGFWWELYLLNHRSISGRKAIAYL